MHIHTRCVCRAHLRDDHRRGEDEARWVWQRLRGVKSALATAARPPRPHAAAVAEHDRVRPACAHAHRSRRQPGRGKDARLHVTAVCAATAKGVVALTTAYDTRVLAGSCSPVGGNYGQGIAGTP